MIEPTYRYRAELHEVHDGDTATFNVDLGMHTFARVPVRIVGVYAPEKNAAQGPLATVLLTAFLHRAHRIIIETQKTKAGADQQSFARWLAVVYLDGFDVAALLKDAYAEAGITDGGIGAKERDAR